MTCDDALATVLLDRPLEADVRAHLASCAACRLEADGMRRVAAALAGSAAPLPPPELSARVLRAAAPLLAHNARRMAWSVLWRAVAAALVPLPLVLAIDVAMVRAAHAIVTPLLPAAIGLYVVGSYALLLTLLVALTYGAVPIVAARQLRLSPGGIRA